VKPLSLSLVAILFLVGVALRIDGLDRSLWLDEAWVANSILEPNIVAMFYYERWLQTSPPGFMLLARLTTSLFGLSDETFRLLPFSLSIWSLVAMWLSLRAFVPSRRFLVIPVAFAAFVFGPESIEYARVLKQYSGDIAVATTLIYIAQRRRSWLLFALPLAPIFSYPSVFLAPGLLLLSPRKLWPGAATAASVLLVYVAFIQPNQSDALRAHWALEFHGLRHIGELLPAKPILVLWAALSVFLIRRRLRLILCLSLSPLLLAAIAEKLGLYPIVPRTALFLLPSLTLAFAGAIWAILLRWHKGMNPILFSSCLLISILGFRNSPAAHTVEQLDEAVTELYSRFAPDDTIYVHASVAEGFRLYSHIRGLEAKKILWGTTSSACCPRGLPHPRGATNAIRVDQELQRLFPVPPKGRVWLIWTGRAEHWPWVGFDERPQIVDYLSNRGCTKKPTLPFESVGLYLFSCGD